MTLKLRFLQLLDLGERRRHGTDAGLLPRWLEHEIDLAETRLAWFHTLLTEMGNAS